MHLRNGWLPKNLSYQNPQKRRMSHIHSIRLRLLERILTRSDIDFELELYNDLMNNVKKSNLNYFVAQIEQTAKGYVFEEKNLIALKPEDMRNTPFSRFCNTAIAGYPYSIKFHKSLKRSLKVLPEAAENCHEMYLDPITWTIVPWTHIKKPSAYCPKARKGVLKDVL